MSKRIDIRSITPCGECCEGCGKKADGLCRGCRETDGHCEEWAGSGVCPAYACAREHGALFCGVCEHFPCDHLPMLKWRPDCIRELTELAQQYRKEQNDVEQMKQNAINRALAQRPE